MRINLKVIALIIMSLLTLSGCESVLHKRVSLENEISIFESEASLVTFLKKVKRYDDIETAYNKDQSRVGLKNRQKKGEYVDEEIVVTEIRTTIKKAIDNSRLNSEIIDDTSVSQHSYMSVENIREALETIKGATESKTNNQEDNVAQGDIIKQLGKNLIILRKGVLYSVSINGASNLELVSTINLQGKTQTHETRYDELLVSKNSLIVTGLNYENGALELIFYTVDTSGEIEFDQRYTIGSYYDVEKSTIRIVGDELIMALPSGRRVKELIEENEEGNLSSLLATRYLKGQVDSKKINIAAKRKWVNTAADIGVGDGTTNVLRCPLDQIRKKHLSCNITSLLGVTGKFYAHENAVYIWSDWSQGIDYGNVSEERYEALLRRKELDNLPNNENRVIYRIGLKDDDIKGVVVKGYPFNEFSFQERNGVFSGVTIQRKKLQRGWKKPVYGMSFELDKFSDVLSVIPDSNYHLLLDDSTYEVQNRFLNEYALVTSSSYKDRLPDSLEQPTKLVIWNRQTNSIENFVSDYEITGLHSQGDNALAIGNRGSNKHLVFESWAVAPESKRLFTAEFNDYQQAESRSVGFNSKADSQGHIFGIPVYEIDQNGDPKTYTDSDGEEQDVINVAYFRNSEDGLLTDIDQLKASKEAVEDECFFSCDEWSEEARPLFIGKYIYALIDNEIIKGELSSGRVKTLNRLNLINGQISVE